MRLLAKSATGVFASRSLAGHLLRGGVAFGCLYWAWLNQHQAPWLALLAGALALVAMRGCPMCWTIGLVETLAQRFRKRQNRPDTGPTEP